MCVTICGRFLPDEGAVAGYGNRIRVKYTAKWGVQIAGMIFQTDSRTDIRLRTYICTYFLKYSSLSWNIFEKCFLKDVHHNLWENILHFTRKTLNATIFPRYLTKKSPCWGIHKENTMELKLENGRPADTTGRLEKEIRTYDFLDALQVPYQRIDHETLMTIEACKDVDKVLDAVICKNLFLCNRQETNFYLLLLPGDKKFKTKEVSSQLGVARLSFGNETYMEKFLDITPGSVSILGLMNDKENHVQLLIDEDLLKEPYIGCHPCINTSSLKINMKDMMEKIIPAMKHEPIFVKLGQEE